MGGWHHRLNGHEFEQAPGVGEGQGSLVCCSPRGRKEMDVTERLSNKNHVYGDKSMVSFWPVTLLSWSPHPHLVSFRALPGMCASFSQDGFLCEGLWEVSRA